MSTGWPRCFASCLFPHSCQRKCSFSSRECPRDPTASIQFGDLVPEKSPIKRAEQGIWEAFSRACTWVVSLNCHQLKNNSRTFWPLNPRSWHKFITARPRSISAQMGMTPSSRSSFLCLIHPDSRHQRRDVTFQIADNAYYDINLNSSW